MESDLAEDALLPSDQELGSIADEPQAARTYLRVCKQIVEDLADLEITQEGAVAQRESA